MGGGDHSDPVIRGGGRRCPKRFFGPSGLSKFASQPFSVFSVVTQRSSCGEESCVTTLKTAVYQTRLHFGLKIIGGRAPLS